MLFHLPLRFPGRAALLRAGLCLLLAFALTAFLLPARPAQVAAGPAAPAATINVTTTADTVDAASSNCAAITVGSLPGPDGVISLREAVCAANNTAGDD